MLCASLNETYATLIYSFYVDGSFGAFWPLLLFSIGSGTAFSTDEPHVMLYPLHRFKMLPAEKQLEQLTLHAIPFDLYYCVSGGEAVLFGYHHFYVELIVEKYTDEILSVCCFQSTRRLAPYLQQIDITEITALLACSK